MPSQQTPAENLNPAKQQPHSSGGKQPGSPPPSANEQDLGGNSFFTIVVPCPEPIVPAELLNAIVQLLLRFMIMSGDQARAVALWIAMTWFINDIKVAPLLIITAPERECGKSILLELLSRLVLRPLTIANTTAAFLFRAIEAWMPTLLVDEADMFARQNDELKGIINAGHTPASAFVGRVVKVGDECRPKMFTVWCAKALAGIRLEKHLPDSTISRGIVIDMRRKLPGERVERLRHAESAEFELLASQLARFVADYAERVRQSRPTLPDQLGDRAHDNWEPLFAIAECAGPEWVEHASTAALALSASKPDANVGSEILADIKDAFDSQVVSRISTADLLAALIADPDAPWATYNNGRPLSSRQLNRLLEPYGIHSKTVRFGISTPKGFEINQFDDAFARYLPATTMAESPADDQPSIASGSDCSDAPICAF